MVLFSRPSREKFERVQERIDIERGVESMNSPSIKRRRQELRVAKAEPKIRLKRRFRAGVREFGGAVNPVPVRLTQAQEDMKELFGGGGRIWGNIQEPVVLNHDLNPSQRGDYGTSEMFGF